MSATEREIVEAFDRGRMAWPTATLLFEPFARRMHDLAVSAEDLAAHGSDLYLASACAEGDAGALRLFDEQLVQKIDAYVARSAVSADLMDEVRQKVRLKLILELLRDDIRVSVTRILRTPTS